MKTKGRQAWQDDKGIRLVRIGKGIYKVQLPDGQVIGEVERRKYPYPFRYIAYSGLGKYLGEYSTRKRAAHAVLCYNCNFRVELC